MKLRHILSGLAALPLALPSAHASAPLPPSSPEAILAARPAGVIPVLTTGNRQAALLRLGASVANAASLPGAGPAITLEAPAEQGFGFAGSSGAVDHAALHFGLLVGMSVILGSDSAALAKHMELVARRRDLGAGLSAEVQAAVDAFVQANRSGSLNTESLFAVFARGEEGIAGGTSRAHGYFTTGVWAGITSVYADKTGLDTSYFVDIAGPLASYLEADATFGGADRQLATEVRALAQALTAPTVDGATWRAIVDRMFKVQPDAQP
jgi:hypothetical protein